MMIKLRSNFTKSLRFDGGRGVCLYRYGRSAFTDSGLFLPFPQPLPIVLEQAHETLESKSTPTCTRECTALRRETQRCVLFISAKAVLHTAMGHGSDISQPPPGATPTPSSLEAKREALPVRQGQSCTEKSLEASSSMRWKPSEPTLLLLQPEGRTRETREETRLLRQSQEHSAEPPKVPVSQVETVLYNALERGSDDVESLSSAGSSFRTLQVKREASLVGQKPSKPKTVVTQAMGQRQGSPDEASPPQVLQEPGKQTSMILMTAKAEVHARKMCGPNGELGARDGSTPSALAEQETFLIGQKLLKPGTPVPQGVAQGQCSQAVARPPQQPSKQTPMIPVTQSNGLLHTAVECGSDPTRPVMRAGSTLSALPVKHEALPVGRAPAVQPVGRTEGLREDARPLQQREKPTERAQSKQMLGVVIIREGERMTESHESTELALNVTSPALPNMVEAKGAEDTEPSEGESLKSTTLVRQDTMDQTSAVEREGLSVKTSLMPSLEAKRRQESEESVELTAIAQRSSGDKDPQLGTEGVSVAKPSAPSRDVRIFSGAKAGQNNPRCVAKTMQVVHMTIPKPLGQTMSTQCQEPSSEKPNMPSAGLTVPGTRQMDENGGFAGFSPKGPSRKLQAQSNGGLVEGNERSNEFARDVPPSTKSRSREARPRVCRQTFSVAMFEASATEVHSTPPATSSVLPTSTASPVVPIKEVGASELTIAVVPLPIVPMDPVVPPQSTRSSAIPPRPILAVPSSLMPTSVLPDPASSQSPTVPLPHETEKASTQLEREPVARVETNEVSSWEASTPALPAEGPDSSSQSQRYPKLPDDIQDVKQEASQLHDSQKYKVLTKTMPSLAVSNSRRATLATLPAPSPSDESFTFFAVRTPVLPATSTSSEPIKGFGCIDKPSQAPAEPVQRLCTIKMQKQKQMPCDGSISVTQPPSHPETRVSLADVREEATILQEDLFSSSPVALPLTATLSTSASLLAPSLGAFPSLQSRSGPESQVAMQKARAVQEFLVSSKLRTSEYLADSSMSSPATPAVLPATEETSDMAPTTSTLHRGEKVTELLSMQSHEEETSRPRTSESLISMGPTSALRTQMVLSPTLPIPPVPIQAPSCMRTPYVLTPHVSTPHVSTAFVRTPSLPTVSVVTPLVSTPLVSTPLVSTPFVSTPPVSTPSVSAPLVSAYCVPTVTVPPTSVQVQTSSVRWQQQTRAIPNPFQASPSMYTALAQTPSMSTPSVSACFGPGPRQRTPMMMTLSQQTSARSTQQQHTPILSTPCLAACCVPTQLQQSPGVGTPLQQTAGMAPFVQQTRTLSAPRRSNATMFTELRQSTPLTTQGQATAAVPLGQPNMMLPNSTCAFPSPQQSQRLRHSQTRDTSNLVDLTATMQPPPSPPRRCFRCGVTGSRPWRTGPDGSQTLCNSCGLQYEHQNMIVYEDIGSGRISAAVFPGSRPAKVIGFHTRGFFSDLSLELADSLGAYRRPPRDFSRPIVAPLDMQNLGSDDRVIALTGTWYEVPANGCDGLPATGYDESRNDTGVSPAIQSIEPTAHGSFGPPENVGDEPPANDSAQAQESVLDESPSCSRDESPVDEPDEFPTNRPDESPATIPFSRFVRRRLRKPTEPDGTRFDAEEARDVDESEQPIDLEAVSAGAFDADAVDVNAVDVDVEEEEIEDQEGERDSDGIRQEKDVGNRDIGSVDDLVREDTGITYVLSESDCPRPAVHKNRIVSERKTPLTRQWQCLYAQENDAPSISRTHMGSGDASSDPRATGALADENTRHNVTGRPSGNNSLLSLRTTGPRVYEQRHSLQLADRSTSSLGRLLNHTEEPPHLVLEQNLEDSARAEFGSVNCAAVRGSSSNSVLAIEAAEHQGSPCSGIETSRQNAGQKRRRCGVELRENSVRQKLRTLREVSFSEVDDSSDDVNPIPRAMQYHSRRQGLASMLSPSPVQTANPVADTEQVQPRLYSVKAEYRSGLHRLAIPHGMPFAEFKTKLQEVFQVAEAIAFQYKDNEDDYITIASDSDMEELYVVVREYSLCPIRIRVCDNA